MVTEQNKKQEELRGVWINVFPLPGGDADKMFQEFWGARGEWRDESRERMIAKCLPICIMAAGVRQFDAHGNEHRLCETASLLLDHPDASEVYRALMTLFNGAHEQATPYFTHLIWARGLAFTARQRLGLVCALMENPLWRITDIEIERVQS